MARHRFEIALPRLAVGVYRAIAYEDDTSRFPLITEIYERYEQESYYVREFYWTIRIMTGPDALALRKRIRTEIGMDNLR